MKDDLGKRLRELGIDSESELKDRLRRDAQEERQLNVLSQTAGNYDVERQQDSALPELACPPGPDVAPPPSDSDALIFWDDYGRACRRYLDIVRARADGRGAPRPPLDEPLVNRDAIKAMEAAREAVRVAISEAARAGGGAHNADGQSDNASSAQASAGTAVGRVLMLRDAVDAFVDGSDENALAGLGLDDIATKITGAKRKLSSLEMDLSFVLGDLSSLPAVAGLESARTAVVDALSSTLQGETASRAMDSLQAIGVALDGPTETPLTAMVLKEKQLALNVAAARNRLKFYDKTIELLEQQEAAYRDELAYLGQAELRRLELVGEGCLETETLEDSSGYLEGLFTDSDPKIVECREIVFRLLVQYSAAWALGRVESEQIDYRLIALHHESALDTSEIAFQRWVSLLEPGIDQLVALSETGLKPSDIVTPIVNALGLGAVAAGVN